MMPRLSLVLAAALIASSLRAQQAPKTPQAPRAEDLLWSRELKAPSFGSGAIADLDGDGRTEILFGAYFGDETLRCLDAKSGKERWRQASKGGPLDASVLVADLDGKKGLETVYGDSAYGLMWCRSAKGEVLWTYQGPSGTDSPPAAADLDGDGKVEIVYGTMKVRGQAGRVVCLDGATGKERWTAEVPGHVQSEPALVDLNSDGVLDVLVTNWMGDGRLRALEGRKGEELWSFETGDWIYHGVSVYDFDADKRPEIVVTDRRGQVHLLEGEDGSKIWTSTLKKEAKGMVFGPTSLVDSDGKQPPEIVVCGRHVHLLDAAGKLRWRKEYGPRSIARGVAVADVDGDGGRDLVFGEHRHLHAIRAQDGADVWAFDLGDSKRRDDHIDHAPLLADFDGDGLLDVFVVVGRGRSGKEQAGNHGCAWALRAGKGRATPENSWTTFRGGNRRLGRAALSPKTPVEK